MKFQSVMNKMKRVAANSCQSNFADAGAGAGFKKQRLLEDYLELQKEYVSRKKKLQIAKQKKETLLAEVRFLRHKRKSFRIQSEALGHEQDPVGPQNSYVKTMLPPKSRNYSVTESVLKSPSPVSDFMGNGEQDVRRKEEAVLKPLRVEKKPKSCLSSKKRIGKKKASWQDQVALKKKTSWQDQVALKV